jgi:hypothetical protein
LNQRHSGILFSVQDVTLSMPNDPQLTVEKIRKIKEMYSDISQDTVSAIAGMFGLDYCSVRSIVEFVRPAEFPKPNKPQESAGNVSEPEA